MTIEEQRARNRIAGAKYRAKNKDKVREGWRKSTQAYQATHPRDRTKTPEQWADYYETHRDKILEYQRRYRAKNPGKSMAYYHANKVAISRMEHRRHLDRTYGITKEAYDAMLIAQCGRCFVCERPFRNVPMEPGVDHDHATGRVRDLLCLECNRALACFTPDLLRRAIAYLERHA